jgi:hypothetical protein
MLETVILDDIRTDGGTQPREYLNELVLSEYAESMAEGVEFPPVVLFFDGDYYWLADGFHRFFAAKKCGAHDLVADVRQGVRRDARLYAVGANAAHGLRRTNADKRRAALTLLQDEEWQRWSNREIARQCGVTHTFVAKLRRELLEALPTPAPPADTTGDTVFEAPAPQRGDMYDQLAPDAPASTMDRLAYEHSDAMDGDPMWEPPAGHPSADAPAADAPARVSPSAPPAPMPDGKLSIAAMASTTQQAPAEWVAEMMVYWLLDMAAQYDGMTPDIVRQAADKLAAQYAQAYQDNPL